jgi:hypothetical protein
VGVSHGVTHEDRERFGANGPNLHTPDWYIAKLKREEQERAASPPPAGPEVHVPYEPLPFSKRHRVLFEAVRTVAACAQVLITIAVLLRVYGVL